MTKESIGNEEFWSELDQLGEEQVRVRLSLGRYANLDDEKRLVMEWLAKRAAEHDQLRRAVEEQARLTAEKTSRSATSSAWIANVLAGIAIVISLVALYFSLR